MAIYIIKLRWSGYHFIFIAVIHIPAKMVFISRWTKLPLCPSLQYCTLAALPSHMMPAQDCIAAGMSLRWRHNGHDSVSFHQPHDCLLNRLFRRRSKETSTLHVTGLCVGNSPGTGEFPAQMASNAENLSIWWRHHGFLYMGSRALLTPICSNHNRHQFIRFTSHFMPPFPVL